MTPIHRQQKGVELFWRRLIVGRCTPATLLPGPNPDYSTRPNLKHKDVPFDIPCAWFVCLRFPSPLCREVSTACLLKGVKVSLRWEPNWTRLCYLADLIRHRRVFFFFFLCMLKMHKYGRTRALQECKRIHTHEHAVVPLVCDTLTTPHPGGQLSSWKGYSWEEPWDAEKTKRKKTKETSSWKRADAEPHRWGLSGEHTLTQLQIGYTSAYGSCGALAVFDDVDLPHITVQIYCSTVVFCLIAPWNMVFTRLRFPFLSDCLIVALGNVTWLPLASSYGPAAGRWVWMLAPFFVCAAFLTPVNLTECRELKQGRTGSAVIILALCPRLTLMVSGRTLPRTMLM